MAKKLKVWNGGGICFGEYKSWHVNVCASSQNEACELINKAVPSMRCTIGYIRSHYSDCWGNDMTNIEPTEKSVYVCTGSYGTPNFKRIKLL